MEEISDKIAAIDISTNNRIAAARGGKIEFRCENVLTPGYNVYFKNEPKKLLTPNKLIFNDSNRQILATTPQRSDLIACFDTETGQNIGEVSSVINSSYDVELDAVTPVVKFSNSKSSDSVSLMATSQNRLFRIDWDPRTPEKRINIDKKHLIISNSKVNYTSVATTGSGHLASGDIQGVVRLYSSPSEKLTRAKTSFTQLPDSVQAIDVSNNGEWVLWTTKAYIALVNTSFQSDDGSSLNGFSKPMGKNKPNALILKLTPAEMKRHGIETVDFKGAKFDNGPYADLENRNIIEEEIVASTGPFIVRWKFRSVKLEYFKTRNSLECPIRPTIYRQKSVIIDKLFEYGKKTLATAAEDSVSFISLNEDNDDDESDYETDDHDDDN